MNGPMIGKVYGIPPQPPVEEHHQLFDAGALRFGVEHRDLDPASLIETYQDNPAYLAELLERSPAGGFSDSGVTVHVFDAADGREFLRFDVFDDEPHYHYIHRTDDESVVNQVIDFDVVAHGPMLDWTFTTLRGRLPDMLQAAGGAELAARVDATVVARALDDVERATRTIAERGARAR
jgi:hypothetical protein